MGILRVFVAFLPLLAVRCSAQLEKLALLASSSTPLGLSNGVAVGNSFDQRDSPSSSFLPGFQRQPLDFQNFISAVSPGSFRSNGFGGLGGGAAGGGTMLTNGLDIETFTKNAAIQANQDNAIVAQLANMAATKRTQLARDVGNRTAVNELVSRIRSELVGSPTGLGSSSAQANRLGGLLGLDPQQQQLGQLQRQLGIGTGGMMGTGIGFGGNSLSIGQQQRLAAENQMLRQMLFAAQNGQSRGLPLPSFIGGSNGGPLVNSPFGISPNQQQQQLLNGQQSLLSAFAPPQNSFPSADSLTRPLAINSLLSDQIPLLSKHAASPTTNIRPSTTLGGTGEPGDGPNDGGEDALLRSLGQIQQGPREGFVDNVEDGFGHRVPVLQQQRQGRDSVIPTSDAFSLAAAEDVSPLPPPPHVARRQESVGHHKTSRVAGAAVKKINAEEGGGSALVTTHKESGGSLAAKLPKDNKSQN